LNPDTLRKLFAYAVLNDKVYRHWALEWLYELQTPNEQARQVTQDRNGAGFTAPDAPILSRLAEKLISGATLNAVEEKLLKQRLAKYWSQFTETRLIDLPDRKPPSRAITRTTVKVKRVAA